MNAKDIRRWAAEATEHFATENDEKRISIVTAQALFEIAAQLAELNSNTRVDTAMKDCDPRFIEEFHL